METYEKSRTIAAVATPPGDGGVAIIRISGESALAVANKIFSKDVTRLASHTLHFGKVITSASEVIDEVLLAVMLGPKSYTGEDTVEIHCHGGSYITKKVLARALEAGAHSAAPGEFTMRAYLNGKIDLIQAEAVQALIAAKGERALKEAEKQLEGSLSIRIKELQKMLCDITAIIEAWVDYPEEGLEFASHSEMQDMLLAVIEKIETLLATFHDGKRMTHAINLCLLGSPNVGKSSLMNRLVGKERAIVTHIAGTTRDLLEEEIEIAGLTFRLMDTAGIRHTEEIIEQEGIRRSKKAAEDADLILYIIDATSQETPNLDALPTDKLLLICNKTDLLSKKATLPYPNVYYLSAKTGDGIEALKQAIVESVLTSGASDKEAVTLTQERHYQAINKALKHLEETSRGFNQGISPEFLAFDLRSALKELGKVIGQDITEEILGSIFSKFCVGK